MTWPGALCRNERFLRLQRHRYARATFLIDEVHGAVSCQTRRSSGSYWRCTYMEDASLPEETFFERLPKAYEAILPGALDYTIERAAPSRMHAALRAAL